MTSYFLLGVCLSVLLASSCLGEDFLLVASRGPGGGIYQRVGLNETWHRLPIREPMVTPTAVTFDPKHSKVIWSDSSLRHIASANLDGEDYHVVTTLSGTVKSMVFDQSSRLLFFTQTDPGLVRVLDVDRPGYELDLASTGHRYTALALRPEEQDLYFASHGENRMEWMTYAGEGRSLFYEASPQAMVYDEPSTRLYVCVNDREQSQMTLIEITTPGGGYKQSYTWWRAGKCRHLALNSSHIFLANYAQREMMIIQKSNFSQYETISLSSIDSAAGTFRGPTTIYYHNSSSPIPRNSCERARCREDDLCIPTSSGSWVCKQRRTPRHPNTHGVRRYNAYN